MRPDERRLVFAFLAKVVVAELPRVASELIEVGANTFLKFPGTNPYYDAQEKRIAYTRTAVNAYWIEVSPDMFCYAQQCADEAVLAERMSNLPAAHIEKFKADILAALMDPEAYERRAAEVRERVKVEREARDAEQVEREARRKEAHERAITDMGARFSAGELIEWSYFEELCARHEVEMHPRTLGSARRSVSQIGLGKMRVSRGHEPAGVYSAARELHAAIVEGDRP